MQAGTAAGQLVTYAGVERADLVLETGFAIDALGAPPVNVGIVGRMQTTGAVGLRANRIASRFHYFIVYVIDP